MNLKDNITAVAQNHDQLVPHNLRKHYLDLSLKHHRNLSVKTGVGDTMKKIKPTYACRVGLTKMFFNN